MEKSRAVKKGSSLLVQCVMRRINGTSAPSALPVRLMAAYTIKLSTLVASYIPYFSEK